MKKWIDMRRNFCTGAIAATFAVSCPMHSATPAPAETHQAEAEAAESGSRPLRSIAELSFGPVFERIIHHPADSTNGGIGLLQIVESTEAPQSVTIRYKLLVTEATLAPTEPSRRLKLIHLRHLESGDLLETMKQLNLIDENLSAAAPRAGLLVLRGAPNSIEEVLCLIQALDIPFQSAAAVEPQAVEPQAVEPQAVEPLAEEPQAGVTQAESHTRQEEVRRAFEDAGTLRPLVLTGHTDWVRGVAFSPDGKRLATGSADRIVRVWDVTSLQAGHEASESATQNAPALDPTSVEDAELKGESGSQ